MRPHSRREDPSPYVDRSSPRFRPLYQMTGEEQLNKLKSELNRYESNFVVETENGVLKFRYLSMDGFVRTLSEIRKNDKDRKGKFLPEKTPRLFQDKQSNAMLVQEMNDWNGQYDIIMYCYIDDTMGPTKDWKEEWKEAMGEIE